jgi:Xaa-Pro aminopeptidase
MDPIQIEKKISRLQNLLQSNGAGCAVMGPTTNMRYMLGFSPHPDERLCLLIINGKECQMIVPALNEEDVRAHTDLPIITWEDADGPGSAMEKSILSEKPASLAVDGSMRADFLVQLLGFLTGVETVPLDPVIADMRVIKSPEEIEGLARAAAQADRAMQAAVEACRPGATETEVAWATEEAFRKDGAEKVEFTLIAAGAHAARPHHSSGEKKLRQGEGIIIDIGASFNGFKSDITRVVFLGEPDKEFLKIYDTVNAANAAGRSAVCEGVLSQEVDRAARSVIKDAGYGDFFIHRTGHGLGLDIHETPWIMEGSKTELKTGMVFSVEPGVYLPGKLGVRVEDIVAVETGGVRLLTGFDHGLVIKD